METLKLSSFNYTLKTFSCDSDYNDRFTPHHSVSQINVIVTDSIKTDLHDALDGFAIKAVIDDLALGSLWMVGNNRKIVSVVDKDLKSASIYVTDNR